MNIKIADRLVKLRKRNHLSQEALAEKLGISRQAVSKWERAEASPDTDNLIMLARLYKVSLDELLRTDDEIPQEESQETENTYSQPDDRDNTEEYVDVGFEGIHVKDRDGSQVHIGLDGIHVEDSQKGEEVQIDRKGVYINGEKKEFRTFSPIWDIPFTALICGLYLVLGFLFSAWHPAWLLFLLIPIWYSFISAVKKKNANLFAYPVFVTFVYLCAGFFFNLWHPGWILYLTIPVYYSYVSR